MTKPAQNRRFEATALCERDDLDFYEAPFQMLWPKMVSAGAKLARGARRALHAGVGSALPAAEKRSAGVR
jgi:hypothetical protein